LWNGVGEEFFWIFWVKKKRKCNWKYKICKYIRK